MNNMKLLNEQKEYERLLELKFKLKRKAHINPLSPIELQLLEELEQKTKIGVHNIHHIAKISQNSSFMIG